MADPHSSPPATQPSQSSQSSQPSPVSHPSNRSHPRRFAALRRFWRERVRPHRGTFVLLAFAGLVGIYTALPAVRPVVNSAASWLASQIITLVNVLGSHGLEAVGIVAPIALLALILVFPLRRRYPYFERRVPESLTSGSVAPIAVYVDAENQPGPLEFDEDKGALPDEEMPYFVSALRSHLNKRRADLYFVMDSSQPVYTWRRKQLRRYGFQLIDAPHDPFALHGGKDYEKNMADMELAVHALRRSMLSTTPQTIIIVANDQGYIPLLYRLWADGHQVELWADDPASAFGVLAAETGKISSNEIVVTRFGSPTPLGTTTVEMVAEGIANTTRRLEKAPSLGQPGAFHQLMNGMRSTLKRLGYYGWYEVATWLDHLQAAGAIKPLFPQKQGASAVPQRGYQKGDHTPEHAAQLLHDFYTFVSQIAADTVRQTGGQPVQLSALCDAVAQGNEPSDTYRLKNLIKPSVNKQRRETHMRFFLQCARAFGMISYDEELLRQGKLVLTHEQLPNVVQAPPPTMAPTTNAPAEPPTSAPEAQISNPNNP